MGVLLSIGCATYAVFHELTDEVDELFDAQLIQASYAVPPVLLPEPVVPVTTDDDPSRQLVIAVWEGAAEEPVYHSRARIPLSLPSADGFRTQSISGNNWRSYTRKTTAQTIQVAQPLSVRSDATLQIAQRLAAPLVVLIPLLIVAVWYLVGRGLRPLVRLATELQIRSPTALQGIPISTLPGELLPVAMALNELMHRLEEALGAQQNFIADAAHEMLTPLTALQVQVQLLERAKTDDRRARAMSDVRTSLDRCVNLARQLLTLARSAVEMPRATNQPVDLAVIVRRVVEEALPQAHHRQIDLGVPDAPSTLVSGEPIALQFLLRNLVDNAIKYSPLGGRVDVSIKPSERPAVTVSDAGPGVPAEQHARIFDRFYRGQNAEIDGTGLGLAIVKRIAEQHAAAIQLVSPGALGGLDVIVVFPTR